MTNGCHLQATLPSGRWRAATVDSLARRRLDQVRDMQDVRSVLYACALPNYIQTIYRS